MSSVQIASVDNLQQVDEIGTIFAFSNWYICCIIDVYHIGIEHDYEQSDQAGYSIRDMDYVDEASGMRTILQLHAYCQSIQFFIVVL